MMWENPNSTHRGVRPAVTDDGGGGLAGHIRNHRPLMSYTSPSVFSSLSRPPLIIPPPDGGVAGCGLMGGCGGDEMRRITGGERDGLGAVGCFICVGLWIGCLLCGGYVGDRLVVPTR